MIMNFYVIDLILSRDRNIFINKFSEAKITAAIDKYGKVWRKTARAIGWMIESWSE